MKPFTAEYLLIPLSCNNLCNLSFGIDGTHPKQISASYYRSARITRCAAAKIDSTRPYSLNAWAKLAQIFGGSPFRHSFQDHRGDF